MCVGRGPGIRRPKKFNSLSRISDRSDPDQLVNKLSRVSLINNAEQSHLAIICKVPRVRDKQTRHLMITELSESSQVTQAVKCHAENKLPQHSTQQIKLNKCRVSDFTFTVSRCWCLVCTLLLFVITELRESVTFNQENY